MQIFLDRIGKRYNREWIFKNLSLSFVAGKSYAITGPNGSGKSTLLQVIAGIIPFSEGNLKYHNQKEIPAEDLYQYVTLATPYLELIEEFTLSELVDFHLKFKLFRNGLSKEAFIQKLRFENAINKEVRYFSSGMKQRLKLGLALYSESSILFLDEPTSNLDQANIDWYKQEVIQHLENRIVIVCSNLKYEYEFCDEVIDLGK